MGATNADRQRRYRAHQRGDHSLCDPERGCETAVTASSVTVEPRNAEAGAGGLRIPRLGKRGRWLWQELVEKGSPGPAERVLIEEACRLADTLDRLAAIANGKDRSWLQIADDIALVAAQCDGEVTVVVDKVLAEQRQQQATLKQVLSELRQASSGAKPDTGQQGGSFRDQLAARRAARLADAAGS